MQEYLPIISLVVLAVVVAIGFIKKINLGFFALGAAFVLGTVGGMKASQITGLAPGQTVKIEIDARHQVDGKIFYVGDLLDEKTRTLPLVIECANADRMLKPGMFVSAVFERHTESVLAIPSSAIFQGEDSKFVYVQDSPGHFRKVQVQVESLEEGMSRVLSGLSGGENIIADGGIYLSE